MCQNTPSWNIYEYRKIIRNGWILISLVGLFCYLIQRNGKIVIILFKRELEKCLVWIGESRPWKEWWRWHLTTWRRRQRIIARGQWRWRRQWRPFRRMHFETGCACGGRLESEKSWKEKFIFGSFRYFSKLCLQSSRIIPELTGMTDYFP